jgi:hypothetical protein
MNAVFTGPAPIRHSAGMFDILVFNALRAVDTASLASSALRDSSTTMYPTFNQA